MPTPTPVLDPAHFPRIITLGDGSRVRVTRCDAADIVFDRIAAIGTTPETYRTLVPAQGALPIAGFDPTTAQAWPTDAELATAIATPVPAPTPVIVLSPLDILSRMTPQEEGALNASTDLAVCIVRTRLGAAQEVRSDDPRTEVGKQILISKGILTAERAAEIYA